MQRDDVLERIGELRTPVRLTARESLACEIESMRQVIDARDVGIELAVRRDAANRSDAETNAAIAALAPDQPRAPASAAHPIIGSRDLDRDVDRFGTGI